MQLQFNMKLCIELEHANKTAHIFLDKSIWNIRRRKETWQECKAKNGNKNNWPGDMTLKNIFIIKDA